MESPVSYELRDGVMVVSMDDGKANAFSSTMQSALHVALDAAQQANAPVVLAGRPGIFSAGFDLKTLAASGQPAVDMLRGGLDLSLRLLEFPTPVVAACSGHAIAMGIFILTSCDYRIGVRGNYRYSANEVAIGMTMPWSTIEILRQRLSPTAVSRAVVFAENFTPDNAVGMGVIDEIVAEDELLDRAHSYAQQSLSLNMSAHAASKRRVRADALSAIRAGLEKDMAGWQKQFLA